MSRILPPNRGVPLEWTRIVAQVDSYRLADHILAGDSASQADRDRAAVHMMAASDTIMADLVTLADAQVLADLTAFLARGLRA
jgi:hypothetical protein